MPKPSRAAIRLSGASLVLLLVLASCGLPTYLYFYPPKDFYSPSANLLALDHDTQNYDSTEGSSQSFKGYEVYYRAYSDLTTASSASATLVSQASTYAESPDSFMSWAQGAGYARLRTTADDIAPLAALSSSAAASDHSFYVNLDPNGDRKSAWRLQDGASFSDLRRSMAEGTRSAFQVSANYQSGDADYAGTSSPATLYFLFFAVAYGIDSSSPWTPVYSAPAVISSAVSFSPGL